MGWLMAFENFRRSSWVSVLDESRKTIVAGFPPNASWLNAFAATYGYDLEVDVGHMEDTSRNGAVSCFSSKVFPDPPNIIVLEVRITEKLCSRDVMCPINVSDDARLSIRTYGAHGIR